MSKERKDQPNRTDDEQKQQRQNTPSGGQQQHNPMKGQQGQNMPNKGQQGQQGGRQTDVDEEDQGTDKTRRSA